MTKVTDQIAEDSNRKLTGFRHLKIDNCILTAESVDGYLGKELKTTNDLPTEVMAGLEDNKIYQVYRPADALKKALDSYNDIPLTDEHHFVDGNNTNKAKWLGNISGHARFEDGKVLNRIAIWDKNEVTKQLGMEDDFSEEDFNNKLRNSLKAKGVRNGLSGGYGFKLLNESGQWNGKHYDFKMKDIECNHVALVNSPRVVEAKLADSNSLINNLEDNKMDLIAKLKNSHPQLVADAEAELKKEAMEIAKEKNKKVKDEDETAEDKSCNKDADFKESTKGGKLSTDEDPEIKDNKEDYKPVIDKKKSKSKDSAPDSEGRVMTADDIQNIVNVQVKEQMSKYNKAREICEGAIGKTAFATDSSPEDMYTSTLKALNVACDGYSLETKQALVKHIAENKVTVSKKPQVIMDSRTVDDFNVIKL